MAGSGSRARPPARDRFAGAGAFLTHRRRGETQVMAINTVLFIVAVVVAGIRFGDL